MAKLDKAFKNIESSVLVTTYDGVMYIYDLLRRRVAVREGKTVINSDGPSKQPTPDKMNTRQSKQSQIQDKEPITQVTAEYHGHGLDEKATPYRKEVNDEASSLGVSRTKSDPEDSEMEQREPTKESPEKTQVVDAGEVLQKLTAAYTNGQLTQFQVDTNYVHGTAIATFWTKLDGPTK